MLLFFFLAIIYLINISLNFSIDLRLFKAPLTQTFGKFESKFYIDISRASIGKYLITVLF